MAATNPYDIHEEPWYTIWNKMHYLGVDWHCIGTGIMIDRDNLYLCEVQELLDMRLEKLAAKIDEARRTAQSGQEHS